MKGHTLLQGKWIHLKIILSWVMWPMGCLSFICVITNHIKLKSFCTMSETCYKLVNIWLILSDVEQSLQLPVGKKLPESEWMARIAVHYLSKLSSSEGFILNGSSKHKLSHCPCPCEKGLEYGETTIGRCFTFELSSA